MICTGFMSIISRSWFKRWVLSPLSLKCRNVCIQGKNSLFFDIRLTDPSVAWTTHLRDGHISPKYSVGESVAHEFILHLSPMIIVDHSPISKQISLGDGAVFGSCKSSSSSFWCCNNDRVVLSNALSLIDLIVFNILAIWLANSSAFKEPPSISLRLHRMFKI